MYIGPRTTPLYNTTFKLLLGGNIFNEVQNILKVHVHDLCFILTSAESSYVSIFSPEVMQRGRLAGKSIQYITRLSAYSLEHTQCHMYIIRIYVCGLILLLVATNVFILHIRGCYNQSS